MRFRAKLAVVVVLSAPLWAADSSEASAPATGSEIIERYLSAVQAEQSHPKPVSMEVDIDANLPRLKKHGRLHAFRFISRLGKIVYNRLHYEGDNTVKKEVIGRYLAAEEQARDVYSASLAITPANYKFKFKGLTDYAGQPAYVFQVNPRKKRVGLYKGELWIDKATFLPLREWGELVKNPSVFLKRVYFVRDYFIYDGVSVPRRLISNIDTRLVGKAQLTIWFDNVKVGEAQQASSAPSGSQMAQADGDSQH